MGIGARLLRPATMENVREMTYAHRNRPTKEFFERGRRTDSLSKTSQYQGVMDSGARMLRRATVDKERLSQAVDNLQEALQQELCRRQALQEHRCCICMYVCIHIFIYVYVYTYDSAAARLC